MEDYQGKCHGPEQRLLVARDHGGSQREGEGRIVGSIVGRRCTMAEDYAKVRGTPEYPVSE